jgi:hypothetical protein
LRLLPIGVLCEYLTLSWQSWAVAPRVKRAF